MEWFGFLYGLKAFMTEGIAVALGVGLVIAGFTILGAVPATLKKIPLIGTLLDPDRRKDPERREKLALVKAIYAVSMDIGFLNRSYRSDNPVEVEMNKAKITSFLKSHGGCRKPVSSQNLEELKATLKQLKAIRRKEEV